MKNKIVRIAIGVCLILALVASIGVCVSLFFNDGEDTDNDVEDTIVQYVELTDARYIAFGDSITHNGDPSYTEVVGETLNLKEYTNKGISGTVMVDWTQPNNDGKGMVNRIGEASGGAEIITIAYGTNDCSFSKALGDITSTESSSFYGAYKKVILGLQRLCPNAQIMLIAPLQNLDYNQANETTKTNGQGKHLIDYVNAVKELGEYYNLPVLDLYNSNFSYSSDSADGVHPSQEYITNNLGPQIAQFIKDNYKG